MSGFSPTPAYTLLYFFAPWHPSHSQLSAVFQSLPSLLPSPNSCTFRTVQAEESPTLTSKYAVKVVPTFVYLKNGKEWGKIEESDPAAISRMLVSMCTGSPSSLKTTGSPPTAPTTAATATTSDTSDPASFPSPALVSRVRSLTSSSPVMILMKGTPTNPKCGFSRKLITLLNSHKVKYSTFDILTSEDVRSAAKIVHDWPTYPQVYAMGELIGGLDVLNDMAGDVNLYEQLLTEEQRKAHAGEGNGDEDVRVRIDRVINSSPVVVLMKGIPSAPKCGFSRQICEVLNNAVPKGYESYNILEDQEFRKEVKAYKEWPTFPQVYVGGELVGGLDVVKDLVEDGEFGELIEEAKGG